MKTSFVTDQSTPVDLSLGKLERGKYSNLINEGTNVAILDPAPMDQFPDSYSVNVALHAFLSLPTETRDAAIRQASSNVGPVGDAFDPRVGTFEKAS